MPVNKNKQSNQKNKTKPGISRKLRPIAVRLADSPLPEITFLSTFILARWWQNSDFSYFSEVFVPIITFSLLAGVIFYIYRLVLGRGLPAHLAALSLSYCLYAYSFIAGSSLGDWLFVLLPGKWETELTKSLYLAAALAVASGVLAWLLAKLIFRYKTLSNLQVYKIILFAIIFMFGVQIYRTAERLWDVRRELSYQYPPTSLSKSASQPSNKPDIYYLLFDRYGNQGALKNNFNYDNKDLYDFLAGQGFANRPDAYANYPFTMSSLSSTMAMSYFPEFQKMFAGGNDWQTANAYRSILNNPPIAQVLKKNGYQYNQLSSWSDLTRIGIKADSNPTRSFRLKVFSYHNYLSDLQRDIINKSVLSPWLKRGVRVGQTDVLKYDLTRNPQENFEAQMTAVKKIAARDAKSTPQFSFAHVLVPHDPYIFDASGKTPSYDSARTDNGIDETLKYTNAVTYLNTRIKDVVSSIKKNSPDAVIVIQADEGPYPKEFRFKLEPGHYYDPANLELPKMKQKFSVLASYYLPGVDSASQPIKSSVNTFRFILNRYLGYDLPMLPDCHFSTGDKYTIYEYQDQTAKLNTQKDTSVCAQYLGR